MTYTRTGFRPAPQRLHVVMMIVLIAGACSDDPSGPAAVASLSIDPGAPAVTIGQTLSLRAVARDAGGRAITGRSATWSSDDIGVAHVSTTGVVTGVSVGTARVTARIDGRSAIATLTVVAPQAVVASVDLGATEMTLEEGAGATLTATPRDANGTAISGLFIGWSSSDPEIVRVDPLGQLTAIRPGTATVTARVHGKEATAEVTVFADYDYDLVYSGGPAGPGRLFRLDLAGGDPQPLLPAGLLPAGASVGAVAPSPDGSRFAFLVGTGAGTGIYLIDRDGTGLRQLTGYGPHGRPTWSPDGRRIAFSRRSAETHDDVWVIEVDGGEPINLTADQDGNQGRPSWSPALTDGSRIAYTLIHEGDLSLWTMRPDGSDKRQLTRGGVDDQASWSPDGTRIAFQRSGVTGSNLWVIDADGENARALPITGLPYGQSAPAWSPDGRLIAFASSHQTPGLSQIYTLWADGTRIARRTVDEVASDSPAWLRRR